mmetsp:Transcript_9646/g.16697  ORF Transcript_9646/g.16697 Transcript_9646/m.16697 type:complete len:200 (+) Transcript_9646:799-1398(+)
MLVARAQPPAFCCRLSHPSPLCVHTPTRVPRLMALPPAASDRNDLYLPSPPPLLLLQRRVTCLLQRCHRISSSSCPLPTRSKPFHGLRNYSARLECARSRLGRHTAHHPCACVARVSCRVPQTHCFRFEHVSPVFILAKCILAWTQVWAPSAIWRKREGTRWRSRADMRHTLTLPCSSRVQLMEPLACNFTCAFRCMYL